MSECLGDVWSYVVKIVRSVTEILVQRQQEVVLEHSLDDIVRRTYDVVVLMTKLDLGKHGLVDVEGLVDDLHLFPSLFLVPLLEFIEKVFVYIVGPVIYLEHLAAVFRAAGKRQDKRKCE